MNPVKTGKDHVASLHDGRDVYVHGERVADVTTHKAFRNSVASAAALYDFQAQPDKVEIMTFASPDTGRRVNRCWQLPENYTELVGRRGALEAWAELHFGFMGRSPDHVASCISGMFMGIELFEAYDRKRAAALRDYYRFARDNDVFLTYVIINPQADRSKSAHEQADPHLAASVVDEDAKGLTIRGAKMLATSSIMANEVFVTCIQPLVPGDEKQAVSFAVPMNARGLRVLSRKSYEESAVSEFDNPLSSRFDENDAVLYFDEVKVPWERVFVNQNIDMTLKQFHGTPAHVYQNYQCQIRLLVKMRFLAGLAHRIAEANGTIGFPSVRDSLGQLAAEVGLVDGLLHGMEVKGRQAGAYFVPDRHLLYSAQTLTQQLYPKVITTIRDLAGGGLIMLPSSATDFDDPMLAGLIHRTQKSPAFTPEERVKFFKLAWDAVGSEFASRHVQYEMFYAGASFVTRGHSYRTFDWAKCRGMVDGLMASYPTPGRSAEETAAAE
ncbi:MAG TPA: 4-hydroxyphenylacetate 3-hydroxylase N-terminal domain-containing protein [Xanthobacteraceae bacterium]|nr:4-hydroxyphenylacetate 3-hydroxylase N-terminal domain-containing protein [Xanthobacteraceae bacterium]